MHVQVNAEMEEEDEEEEDDLMEQEESDNQFITAVRGFFTKDSDSFPTRSSRTRLASSSPHRVPTTGSNNK